MLEQIIPLWPVYLKNQKDQKPLVLATLVNVDGSSFKNPGAMMLIEQNGKFHGMISGGCLESDVAEHAIEIFSTKTPKVIEYDLSDESIFGLGAGCDGTITLLLQLLHEDYLPFSSLNPSFEEAQNTSLYLNYQNNSFPLGAFSVHNSNQVESDSGFLSFAKRQKLNELKFQKPPRVAIFGAGNASLPVCQFIHQVHWHGISFDYREGLLAHERFPKQWRTEIYKKSNLKDIVDQFEFDAAIIMNQNLEQDALCLRYCFERNVSFIGLLGSVGRRQKVLNLAKLDSNKIGDKLKSPVGITQSCKTPENIAISIVAQLQEHFYHEN